MLFHSVIKGTLWGADQACKTDRQYNTALRKVEPYQPIKSQEPIQLSKIPNAKTDEHHVAPIERDDWPAPPALAAAYPELLREHRREARSADDRPSTGGKLPSGYTVDGQETSAGDRVNREIEELSKMTDSGAAQVSILSLFNNIRLSFRNIRSSALLS